MSVGGVKYATISIWQANCTHVNCVYWAFSSFKNHSKKTKTKSPKNDISDSNTSKTGCWIDSDEWVDNEIRSRKSLFSMRWLSKICNPVKLNGIFKRLLRRLHKDTHTVWAREWDHCVTTRNTDWKAAGELFEILVTLPEEHRYIHTHSYKCRVRTASAGNVNVFKIIHYLAVVCKTLRVRYFYYIRWECTHKHATHSPSPRWGGGAWMQVFMKSEQKHIEERQRWTFHPNVF